MNAFRDSESDSAGLLLKHSNFKQRKFTANNASFLIDLFPLRTKFKFLLLLILV